MSKHLAIQFMKWKRRLISIKIEIDAQIHLETNRIKIRGNSGPTLAAWKSRVSTINIKMELASAVAESIIISKMRYLPCTPLRSANRGGEACPLSFSPSLLQPVLLPWASLYRVYY